MVAVATDLGVHLKNSPGRRRSGDQKQSRHQRFPDRSRSPDYRTVREIRDRDSEDKQDLWSRKMKSAGHERARESANEGDSPRNFLASRQGGPRSSAISTPFNQTQQSVAPAVRGFQFSSTSPLLPTSRPFMGADVGTMAPFARGPAGPYAAVSPSASPVGRQHRDGEQQNWPTFPLSKPLPLGWNAVADTGTEAKPLSTPFLSDLGVQRRPPARSECRSWWEDREGEQANWSPDKFQAEQLKQQQYAPHSSPPRSAPHSSPPHSSSKASELDDTDVQKKRESWMSKRSSVNALKEAELVHALTPSFSPEDGLREKIQLPPLVENNAASWANAANVPNQAPYPPQRFGGVLSSHALPQKDRSWLHMHASTSGAPSQAQGSGAYPNGSQQQEHVLQHQHRDNAALPPKTT